MTIEAEKLRELSDAEVEALSRKLAVLLLEEKPLTTGRLDPLARIRPIIREMHPAFAAIHRSALAEDTARAAERAIADIAAERRRQVEAEGWTPAHDDSHDKCELARAAACYALARSPVRIEREWVYPGSPKDWPWSGTWWKPGFYRRNLVKAGALIVAEIERWDRLTPEAPHADR